MIARASSLTPQTVTITHTNAYRLQFLKPDKAPKSPKSRPRCLEGQRVQHVRHLLLTQANKTNALLPILFSIGYYASPPGRRFETAFVPSEQITS